MCFDYYFTWIGCIREIIFLRSRNDYLHDFFQIVCHCLEYRVFLLHRQNTCEGFNNLLIMHNDLGSFD